MQKQRSTTKNTCFKIISCSSRSKGVPSLGQVSHESDKTEGGQGPRQVGLKDFIVHSSVSCSAFPGALPSPSSLALNQQA